MHSPANDAYVIPMGIDFITFDKPYIHKIIVKALSNDGTIKENPSADFAKLLESVPNRTANNRNRYGVTKFIAHQPYIVISLNLK
jgi:hypothetical protein|tara:strand:+ start:80 stop:334 length:255 start_codon:yes stop_codon:yes gene_type:complete